MNKQLSPKLLCDLTLKRSLAKTNVANFARIYGKIELSPGQERFARWITKYPEGDPSGELRQAIAKVARGGGKTSTVASAFAYLHAIDKTWKISVHSGALDQARYLYAYYEPYLKFPELFPPDCFAAKPTRNLTQFKEGGFLRVLAASEKQSRGGHVDIGAMDEAVLIKQELRNAAIPTIRASRRPMLIVTSTASPNVGYRWFITNWQNAKELRFERFEWSPNECHWIDKRVTARLALLMDKATASVELEGGIAEFKGFVFAGTTIDKAIVNPTKEDGSVNEEEWPLPSAPPLTEWVVGVDWGFVDPTIIIDVEIRSDVVYVRDVRIRERELLNDVLEEIKIDFKDRRIYAGNDGAGEIGQLKAYGLKVTPVIFGTEKALLIAELRRRFERGLIKILDPKKLAETEPQKAADFTYLVEQLRQYHYNEKSEKPEKENDHAVDALLHAMKFFVEERPPKLGYVPWRI